MSWIVTASGKPLQFDYPTRSICIEDIAHHLSQINRFSGACIRPESVAEHSILVSEILEREAHASPAVCMAGLLHDAHEAYCGDVNTPFKRRVGRMWEYEEEVLQRKVLRALGFLVAFEANVELIGHADRVALATEKRDLVPEHPVEWDVLRGIEPVGWVRLNERDEGLGWKHWRQAFLDRYAELQYAIALQIDAIPELQQ